MLALPAICLLLCLTALLGGCKPDTHDLTGLPASNFTEEVFQPNFNFPTKNHALLDVNGSEHFFTPTTTAKSWTSGTFGCVRNSRTRLHEGIDIASVEHDENGEPIDPVAAVFHGEVVHVNRNTATSNYGKYVVLRHSLDGFGFYSLYAHLNNIQPRIQTGSKLDAGDKIGVLGRTTNTREKIERWRAHLHFEIGIQLNSNFKEWFPSWYKEGVNLHGNWNGLNLLGLDAADIFTKDRAAKFSFADHLKEEPILCRVRVYRKRIDYIERHRQLCINLSSKDEPTAWDISFNFLGVPTQAEAVFESQENTRINYKLLSVNGKVHNQHPCSGLVFKRGQSWVLTSKGQRFMNLLIFH